MIKKLVFSLLFMPVLPLNAIPWGQRLLQGAKVGSCALTSLGAAALMADAITEPHKDPYTMPDGTMKCPEPVSPQLDKKIRNYLGSLIPPHQPLVILQDPKGYNSIAHAWVIQIKSTNYLIVSNDIERKFTSWFDWPTPHVYHTLRHEAGHLNHNHSRTGQTNENLACTGLSALAARQAYKHYKFPQTPAWRLASIPAYVVGVGILGLLKTRAGEYEADKFSVEKATDAELLSYIRYSSYLAKYEPQNFITFLKQLASNKISTDEFLLHITHPGPHEVYDMFIAEVKKRGLKLK